MNDIRYALRTFARQPSFAIAAVTTLGLGIAVNTIVFSLINSLLLRPMPLPDAQRIVRVYPVDAAGRRGNAFSYPDYLDYRRSGAPFEALAAYIPAEMTAGHASIDRDVVEPRAVLGYVVSSTYFDLTGVRPSLGRVLQQADDGGGSHVVVLSHAFWRARLGADPAAIGSTLTMNGRPLTIVGVAAPGFAGTEPLVADCWVPLSELALTTGARDPQDRHTATLLMLGRLAPHASIPRVTQALTITARQLSDAYPSRERPASIDVVAATFFTIDPGLKPIIAGVMTVVGLVLLIACANAANLALARATSRRREIALRLAIGASRRRIVRQLLVEAMLIGLMAGAGGLLAAEWALRGLYRTMIALAALPWAVTLTLAPDVRVFGYTLGLALVSGAILGLLPALQASSPGLVGALQGQGVFSGRVRGRTVRHALVVAQIAASLVLLFGAGLLLRALGSADALDLGFATAGVVYGEADPRSAGYTPARAGAFNRALLDSARTIPGVVTAAMTSHVPLHGGVRSTPVRLVGSGRLDQPSAIVSTVSPEYFAVLQLPFVAGHGFAADGSAPGTAIVISEGLARRFWRGESPIGKSVVVPPSGIPRTVVGVVRDATTAAIWRDKELAIYLPIDASTDPRDLKLLVRTTGETAPVSRLLARRAAVLGADMRFTPRALDDLLRLWKLPSRVAAAASAVLAAMALALACVGLYGVLAFAVGERTRELGIRMALGADARSIVRLILGDAWRLVAAGLVVGAAGALPAATLLDRLLFGVSAFDPLTLATVVIVLIAVALGASYLPARRASRLQPLLVLRAE